MARSRVPRRLREDAASTEPVTPPRAPPGPPAPLRRRRPSSGALATGLLVVLAILGPLVAYAGITVIYPAATLTTDVDESPPITFAAGADHAQAQTIGFSSAFTAADNSGAFTLTVNGLSGGNITIDDLVTITKAAEVTSFKMDIDTAYSGTLTPDVYAVRLWTGGTAPTVDGDAQVCAVLDLTASVESAASCTATTVKVQVIIELPSGMTTESGTVTVRPSSIVFA